MKEKVVLLKCSSYDKHLIVFAVWRGLEELGVKPEGRIFVKPNVVFSHYNKEGWGDTMYTSPDFVEAAIFGLPIYSEKMSRIDIGEKSGIGTPTRTCLRWAGYRRMARRLCRKIHQFPLRLFEIEEDRRKEIHISGVVHSDLRLSRTLVDSDWVVSIPKLKGHGLTAMTCAMKLNVGILDDDDRAFGHDYRIHDKIVDTVEAVRFNPKTGKNDKPQLIIVDGIHAGVGMEMGSKWRPLNLIIMGTNHLAVDLVCSRLYGFNPPEKIIYIKKAIERGLGPASLEDVEIVGDYTKQDLGMLSKRLEPYNADHDWWVDAHENLRRVESPIELYFGPCDVEPREQWCGSCNMAFRISMAAIESHAGAGCFKKGRPLVVVIGKHGRGRINCEGKDVLIIGQCSQAELVNYGKVKEIRNCFTTVLDLFPLPRMAGLPNPILAPRFFLGMAVGFIARSLKKALNFVWRV